MDSASFGLSCMFFVGKPIRMAIGICRCNRCLTFDRGLSFRSATSSEGRRDVALSFATSNNTPPMFTLVIFRNWHNPRVWVTTRSSAQGHVAMKLRKRRRVCRSFFWWYFRYRPSRALSGVSFSLGLRPRLYAVAVAALHLFLEVSPGGTTA